MSISIPSLCYKIVYHFITLIYLLGMLFGQNAYSSLDVAYHFRSIGMSGSGVADLLNADVSTLNPALLAGSRKTIILSAIRYPAAIQTQFLEWRAGLNKWHMAATYRGVNYGDFNERDLDGTELGSFSAADAWMSLALAKSVSAFSEFGASAGFFQSRIGSVQAILGLLTLGGRVTIPPIETSLGVSIRNIGTTIETYSSYKEQIPTSVAIGLTRKMAYLPLLLSIDTIWWKERSLIKVGGEFSLPKNFFVQIGSSSLRNDLKTGELWRDITSGISMGIGCALPRTSLGFAVGNGGVGGVSVGLGFSRIFE